MQHRAFTLVEMLFVVLVIIVIAGIVFPVITRARQRSTAVKRLAVYRQAMLDAGAEVYYSGNAAGTGDMANESSGAHQLSANATPELSVLTFPNQRESADGPFATTNAIVAGGVNHLYGELDGHATVQGTYATTVCLWFKPSDSGSSTDYTLMCKGYQDEFPLMRCWLLDYYTGQFRFLVAGTAGFAPPATWSTTLDASHWYFVAGTYDGTTGEIILYVDGIEQGTATMPGTLPVRLNSSTKPVVLGKRARSSTVAMANGAIAHVACFSTALTAAQLTEFYRLGKP